MLTWGCDFYIYVYLEIQHVNGVSYYQFPTIRGYYCELECGIYDSNDDEKDDYYNSEKLTQNLSHFKSSRV